MDQFKQFVIKETMDEIEDYMETIQKIIAKYFPNSFIQVTYENDIAASITIRFALGKDRGEWKSGIIHNDPLHHIIFIRLGRKQEIPKLPNLVETKMSIGGIYSPRGFQSKNQIKLGWKNVVGTPDKVLQSLEKYFSNMAHIYKSNPLEY